MSLSKQEFAAGCRKAFPVWYEGEKRSTSLLRWLVISAFIVLVVVAAKRAGL